MPTVLVTEYKTRNIPENNMVRIFIDRDFHYGHFVDERALFNELNDDQKDRYRSSDEIQLNMPWEAINRILEK